MGNYLAKYKDHWFTIRWENEDMSVFSLQGPKGGYDYDLLGFERVKGAPDQFYYKEFKGTEEVSLFKGFYRGAPLNFHSLGFFDTGLHVLVWLDRAFEMGEISCDFAKEGFGLYDPGTITGYLKIDKIDFEQV